VLLSVELSLLELSPVLELLLLELLLLELLSLLLLLLSPLDVVDGVQPVSRVETATETASTDAASFDFFICFSSFRIIAGGNDARCIYQPRIAAD